MKTVTSVDKQIRLTTAKIPKVHDHEVLIKVAATGVNRADLLQVEGLYHPPPGITTIPGLEVSGTVVSLGSKVTSWRPGDKVCALLPGGGYAEYVTAHHKLVLPIPDNLDFVQAAALPEAIFTVYFNLFHKAKIRRDDILLITASASGIGSLAIQMAKTQGAKVISMASSHEKCEFCLTLGADYTINYREQDLITTINNYTKGQGVNIILDMLGGQYFTQYPKCLSYNGKLLIIGLMQGSSSQIGLGSILLKNLTIMGSTLRSQTLATKSRLARNILAHWWPKLAQNKIKPAINKVFPFIQVEEAHNYMRNNLHMGKIVLIMDHNNKTTYDY